MTCLKYISGYFIRWVDKFSSNRRSRAPCPICRAELDASSTWCEVQEEILQMKRKLRFERIKARFITKKNEEKYGGIGNLKEKDG